MRASWRRAVQWAVALAGIVLATTAMAQQPIRIGSFLSTTGPASFLGDPELKTLKLYVEKINAQGGVLGRKLE
ncbi:ABC transporter substrate-binding protein, partial [Escherichia coli]|uniref:ABC transporter substrate-binding protein n=1 Tax=Escherichia coli TaxID=562 RepID=UPI0021196E38